MAWRPKEVYEPGARSAPPQSESIKVENAFFTQNYPFWKLKVIIYIKFMLIQRIQDTLKHSVGETVTNVESKSFKTSKLKKKIQVFV